MRKFQNKSNSSLKGFTYVELLAVMIISGVVISMIYLVLNWFNYLHVQNKKVGSLESDLILVMNKLETDLYNAKTDTVIDSVLYIFPEQNSDTILWKFSENRVITGRKQQFDTLILPLNTIEVGMLPERINSNCAFFVFKFHNIEVKYIPGD